MSNDMWHNAAESDDLTRSHDHSDDGVGTRDLSPEADVPYADGYPGPRPYPMTAQPPMHGYGIVSHSPGGFTPPPGLIDPMTGETVSNKSKALAGLLQCAVGWLGVGRFYIGDVRRGGLHVAAFVLGMACHIAGIKVPVLWALSAWCIVDAAYIWSGRAHDQFGRRLN